MWLCRQVFSVQCWVKLLCTLPSAGKPWPSRVLVPHWRIHTVHLLLVCLHCPYPSSQCLAGGCLPVTTKVPVHSRFLPGISKQRHLGNKRDAVEGSSVPSCITITTNNCCTALALQLPLDDVVLSHSAQLDLFVQNLRQQLADQAAAAKVAKAEAAAAAAAAAAGHRRTSGRRSRSRHTTPRNHYQQPAMGQADAAGDMSAQVGPPGTAEQC